MRNFGNQKLEVSKKFREPKIEIPQIFFNLIFRFSGPFSSVTVFNWLILLWFQKTPSLDLSCLDLFITICRKKRKPIWINFCIFFLRLVESFCTTCTVICYPCYGIAFVVWCHRLFYRSQILFCFFSIFFIYTVFMFTNLFETPDAPVRSFFLRACQIFHKRLWMFGWEKLAPSFFLLNYYSQILHGAFCNKWKIFSNIEKWTFSPRFRNLVWDNSEKCFHPCYQKVIICTVYKKIGSPTKNRELRLCRKIHENFCFDLSLNPRLRR